METNAKKSKTMSNKSKNDKDFPQETFYLGDDALPETIANDKIVRLLGVFWTLDGHTKKPLN